MNGRIDRWRRHGTDGFAECGAAEAAAAGRGRGGGGGGAGAGGRRQMGRRWDAVYGDWVETAGAGLASWLAGWRRCVAMLVWHWRLIGWERRKVRAGVDGSATEQQSIWRQVSGARHCARQIRGLGFPGAWRRAGLPRAPLPVARYY
eukprot:SAG22_NODE_116_length_19306_cov_247.696517_8_plen_147_part_00